MSSDQLLHDACNEIPDDEYDELSNGLYVRTMHGSEVKMRRVRNLIEQEGADPNGILDGETPIFKLLRSGSEGWVIIRCFHILLEHGCNINHVNSTGLTPLHMFLHTEVKSYSGQCVLAALLEAGADPCARDANGRGMLFHAWFAFYGVNGYVPVVKTHYLGKLLHKKYNRKRDAPRLDINQVNNWGDTFLHEVAGGFVLADETGTVVSSSLPTAANAASGTRHYPAELMAWRYRLVKQLLKWGANPFLVNNKGRTPADLVMIGQKDDKKVARLFVNIGM